MQEEHPSDYIFCYDQNSPSSLVILQHSDSILPLLLSSTQQLVFLWLDPSLNEQHQKQILKIQNELKQQIIQYHSLQLLSTHITEKRFAQQILVVCTPEMRYEMVKLAEIKYIVCYPSEEYFDLQDCSQFLYYAESEQVLLNIMKMHKEESSKSEYKWLSNFLNLNHEVSTSNTMVRTLWAMVNCEDNASTRVMIIYCLRKLIQRLESLQLSFSIHQNACKQFLRQLSEGNMSCERSLYWYTLQSPIFRLVNNLLRSARSPCLLFYIQPYFKSLFNAVGTLYKQQSYKRQFTCYRGGKITEQELERFENNLGGIIQNLGFLSTSLDKKVTETYIKNVLFEIVVDEGERSSNDLGFGYASVSEHSNYFEENEILFNPLNFFKILSIKEKTTSAGSIFFIHLKFRAFQINKRPVSTQDQKLSNWLIKEQQYYKNKIKCQGDIFCRQFEYRNVGLLYWCQFTKLAQERYNKYKMLETSKGQKNGLAQLNKKQCKHLLNLYQQGLNQMAIFYSKKGQRNKALQIYKTLQKNLNLKISQTSDANCDILSSLASFYEVQGDYDKSIQLYQIARKIVVQRHGQGHEMHAQILKQIATVLIKKQKFVQAQTHYQAAVCIKHNNLISSNSYEDPQILNGLGEILKNKKDLVKALQRYWKSLKIVQKLYGNGIFYADILDNLANIYQLRGQFQTSLRIANQALIIKQRQFGYYHIQTAYTLSIQACGLHEKCLLQDALESYKKSVEILEKLGHEELPLFINNLLNIGHIHNQKDQLGKALAWYLRAGTVSRRIKGQNSQLYATVLNSKARIYLQAHQFDKALQLLIESQNIIQNSSGKEKQPHSQVLISIANYALVFFFD